MTLLPRYFNPRSHKGSDPESHHFRKLDGISIHAPTRGATGDLSKDADCREISIHAPTRGATNKSFCHKPMNLFQSTLPQGERPCVDSAASISARVISIHAPTRGATAILHKIPYLFYFIFTNPFPISYFHTQPASDF